MTSSIEWRAISSGPGRSSLFAFRPSTKSFLVLDGGAASRSLFELDATGAKLLAAGAAQMPVSSRPLAIYEDAGAPTILVTADGRGLSRYVLGERGFELTGDWPQFGIASGAFAYDPSGRCGWWIQGERPHGIRQLRGEWSQIGTVPLEPTESRCELVATYEPAEKRVVVVGGVNAGGGLGGEATRMIAFAISDNTILPLPAPRLIPRVNAVKLVSHPVTGRALLMFEPGRNHVAKVDIPAEPALTLDRSSGWTKVDDLELTSCFAAAAGAGELVLYGARHPVNRGRVMLARTSGKQLSLSPQTLMFVTSLVAGPAGVCAAARNVMWDRSGHFVYALDDSGWHHLPDLHGIAVAIDDDFLFVAPDGAVTRKSAPTVGKGTFAIPEDAGVVWDASRKSLIAFGGSVGDRSTNLTREWTEGGWKELKPKAKPLPRTGPLMCHVPGIGVVMVGGEGPKKAHAETCVFDGKTWEIHPGLKGIDASRLAFLGYDAASNQLLLGETSEVDRDDPSAPYLRIHRYLGKGRWVELGRATFHGGAFGFGLREFAAAYDPVRREVVGAGTIDDDTGRTGIVRASLSAQLDALTTTKGTEPRVEEPTVVPRDQMYLVLRDEGVGTFWFGERAGTSWTARWGKRGAAERTAKHSFKNSKLAAADLAKHAQAKLAEGYVVAPSGEAIGRLAGADAYPMKFRHRGTGHDHVFGLAPIAAAKWPRCSTHKTSMGCLGVFHADAKRFALTKHAALVLFGCSPSCDAFRAVLVTKKDLVAKPVAPAKLTPEEPQWITYGPSEFEVDYLAEEIEDDRKPRGSKLGGTATWVQAPELPHCAKCKQAMRLAVQLDSRDTGMNFGDLGIGYVFVCPVEHEATFVWQSA